MEVAMPVVFVVGAPGAGKGTLCKRLEGDYGLKHVSVGDMLRQVVSSFEADKTVVEYIKNSELLPTDLLFSVLKPHLQLSGGGGAKMILLDGFPRRLDQAKAFGDRFDQPRLVLFFDCPKNLAEDRVVTRQLGREEDNLEMFRKRYREFSELNPPVMDYYSSQNKLIRIDTSGVTDVSYAKLLDVLKTRPEWKF